MFDDYYFSSDFDDEKEIEAFEEYEKAEAEAEEMYEDYMLDESFQVESSSRFLNDLSYEEQDFLYNI